MPPKKIGALMTIAMVITLLSSSVSPVFAQDPVFDGPGLSGGVEYAGNVEGIAEAEDPRTTIADILTAALNFAAILAVIMIIIAGFYLVLSLGEDEKKDKAKKIIYYTLIGLMVLLFARIIVGLVTVLLYNEIT